MGMLIVFRFLQGIGAGAVQPVTTTLAADLYSLEERGRVQGFISSVWGVSSIVGPLAGGLIVHSVGWPWIFWANVPFGIAAIALVTIYLHEGVEPEARRIDVPGAVLLLAALGPLMVALTQAGTWGLTAILPLLAVCVVALALFVRQERRAQDPLMHLELWNDGLIRNANLATLTSGILMIGIISFLPTYVQGVLGRSALVAGFALSAMTLGWPLSAWLAGRRIIQTGVPRLVRSGGACLLAGALVIAVGAPYGAVAAGIGSFVIGVGMGLLNSVSLVAIQSSVPWRLRGGATALNMLMRILGSALGAALFGGVLNYQMARYLGRSGLEGRVSLDDIQELLGEAAPRAARMGADVLAVLRQGLAESLHVVFWGVALLALLSLLAAWRVPPLKRVEE
jgi:MFS family permease